MVWGCPTIQTAMCLTGGFYRRRGNKRRQKGVPLLSRLRNYLFHRLDRHSSECDDELYKNTMLLAVAVLSTAVYLFYAVFFAFYCLPLTISHAIGIFVYVFAIVLLIKKRTYLAGLAMAVMMLLLPVITIHTIGGGSFPIIYQYLVLLVVLILPFKYKAVGLISSVLIPLVIIGTHIFDLYTADLYDIGPVNNALSIVNLSIASVGILALLSMQRFIKDTIGEYRSQKMVELQAQAYIDPLTQLYNRRYADIYLDTRDGKGIRKAYIAVADIDDFKIVNDTYGHDAGDVVLKIIAKIMKDNTGSRHPVFRWGGEEFMAIFYDMTEHEAVEHAEKVRRLIYGTPMLVGDVTLRISVTIGIAELDPANFDGSFNDADRNMYYGKQHGKNQVVSGKQHEQKKQ